MSNLFTTGKTAKYVDEAYVEYVVNKVVGLLDKREADKKLAEQNLEEHRKEEQRRIKEDDQRKMQECLDKLVSEKKAYQAECKHERKRYHNFSDGIERWTICDDIQCGKLWKEKITPPIIDPEPSLFGGVRSKFSRCHHIHNNVSTIHEVVGPQNKFSFVTCSICMRTWK
jgi:hypothetical protein